MQFFLLLMPDNNMLCTPFPEMDKPAMRNCHYLHPGLPLVYLLKIYNQRLGKKQNHQISQSELQAKLIKRATKFFGNDFAWEWRPVTKQSEATDDPETKRTKAQTESGYFEERLDALISGRQFTEYDLKNLAKTENLEYDTLLRRIHKFVQTGMGAWIPAVEHNSKGWQCSRCGETEVEHWISIYGEAATCPSCNALGDLSSMQVIYRDRRPMTFQTQTFSFSPHWELTTAQAKASREVMEFIQHPQEKEGLLWAACGAGKTEVCFPATAWALEQQKNILFAAPRQDVIHDVAPRIERDFPGLKYQVLSGANPLKFQTGNLILATTHQVLRFYQTFDAIFLDEFDAFPYRGSRMLEWGLKQALKPEGKLLYLTATPSKEKIRQLKHYKYVIRLPARHHRRALPVPLWERLGIESIKDINDCPEVLIRKLMTLGVKGPVMLFVPKISWVEALVMILRNRLTDFQIEGSFSSDPLRSEKIIILKQLRFNIFVTTSILERGVTIPNTQVIVLAADHKLFDERALVQMAGRAGRSKEYPQGEVVFFARQKNLAIKTAIQWIEEQNRLARSMNLLD